MARRDPVALRLSLLCILAGLPPMAWMDLTADEFCEAVRRRAAS